MTIMHPGSLLRCCAAQHIGLAMQGGSSCSVQSQMKAETVRHVCNVCGHGTTFCQDPHSSGCVVRAFVLLPSHHSAYVTEAHSYSPPEVKKPTFANAESC